ncbi:MAG: phage protease [Puniceicoccales bacterium]|nr:phage protease [Puniceicoccales bacterium]
MSTISTLLLNRQDGELPPEHLYQIAPLGEFPIRVPLESLPQASRAALADGAGKDGTVRILQVVDADAAWALASSLPEGRELLVDYDHESLDTDKSTRAAGWLSKASATCEGLYANIAWTDRAAREIAGREFRFLSPVFASGDSLAHLGGNRFRVTRLLGAAVTNNPNLRTIKPLSNRDTPGEEPPEDPGADKKDTTKTTNPTHTMNAIAKALGLAEGASEADILAAIAALKDATAALETEAADNRRAQAATLCDKHGITGDEAREKFAKTYIANRAVAEELLSVLPPKTSAEDAPGALTNRHPAKTPGAAAASALHPFLNRAAALRKEKNLTEADAYIAAARENPQLYAEYNDSLKPA